MAFDMPIDYHKLYRKNNHHFSHIEGLRGLAAISIMLCHITIYGSLFFTKAQYLKMLEHPLCKVIATSGVFLDIFFIISGFLIGYLLIKQLKEGEGVNLGGFLLRRFARIYPLYLFVLLMAIPFSTGKFHHVWTNILLINNILPMNEQYLNWSWTIAVEFQFYFVIATIIWLISKNIIGKKTCCILAVGFVLLPLIIIASLMVKYHYYHITNDVFLVTSYEFQRVIAMGFDKLYLHTTPLTYGVITAYLMVYHKSKVHDFLDRLSSSQVNILALSVLGLLLALFANHYIWSINQPIDVWQRGTVWILLVYRNLFFPLMCTLLLLTSAPKGIVMTSIVKFLNLAVWRPVARLSYGSYLIHPILLLLGYSIFFSMHKSVTMLTYYEFGFGMILLTYLIATPLYLLLEQPALQLILQTLFRHQSRATTQLDELKTAPSMQ
jgi:peptidoglycan/LPS O-acetylase OafA/YrhL